MRHYQLLLAAALSFSSPATAQGAEPYRAIGTEPFWSVTIDSGRMVYDDPEGNRVSVRTPVARPSFNGRRYVTRRLTVDITRQQCSDGMSDRVFAETVRVLVDGRSLEGCGGAVSEPSRLANTHWRISRINGLRIGPGPYQIEFTEGRLSGQAGCNRLGGSYRLEGDRLTAGPIAATRMACPPRLMAHEAAVLRVLNAPVRVMQPSEHIMVLTGRQGTVTLELVPGARPRF
jgi:heat shock protein HslJ